MALVQEDGSNVAGANTYALVVDLDGYATLRGIELPAGAADKEVLLIKAMDYVEAQEKRFKGMRKYVSQELAWPRYGVWVNGFLLPSDKIPKQLIAAQCQLAVDVMTLDLQPNAAVDSRSVRKEKVGPIETEYSDVNGWLYGPILAKAESLLDVLCDAGGFSLTIGRA